MMDSLTQQQELFATLSDMDASDGLLVTAMVQVMEQFGWTSFSATEEKRPLQTAHIGTGTVKTVATVKMFQFHVPK